MKRQICKIDNCSDSVRIKKLGLCSRCETAYRRHGDPTYKKTPVIPLHIPGGEIITNFQKAKKIRVIVEELRKMIICGYIDKEENIQVQAEKLFESGRYDKKQFFWDYIQPLLNNNMELSPFITHSDKISSLVKDLIEKSPVPVNGSILILYDLTPIGIKKQNGEFAFIDSDYHMISKCMEHEGENIYDICYNLQLHYKRFQSFNLS